MLGGIAHIAQGLASSQRHTRVTALDAMDACEEQGVTAVSLIPFAHRNANRRRASPPIAIALTPAADVAQAFATAQREPARAKPAPPPVLPSAASTSAPARFSFQPKHFPLPPPEHAYMRTPVYGSLSAPDLTLARLEERKDTDRLVQTSLRNLVRATMDPKAATAQAGKPRLKLFLGGGRASADATALVSWETAGALGKRGVSEQDGRRQRLRWR